MQIERLLQTSSVSFRQVLAFFKTSSFSGTDFPGSSYTFFALTQESVVSLRSPVSFLCAKFNLDTNVWMLAVLIILRVSLFPGPLHGQNKGIYIFTYISMYLSTYVKISMFTSMLTDIYCIPRAHTYFSNSNTTQQSLFFFFFFFSYM